MSFREFSLKQLHEEFAVEASESLSLFADVPPTPISSELAAFWGTRLKLGLSLPTEKGRSEFVTSALLAEVWASGAGQISLLSGPEWSVDPDRGLVGVPDFLLCRSKRVTAVAAPVLTVVEAKRDSIPGGYGQCAAEMLAAQIFNSAQSVPIDPVYGCVTTGSVWKFLRLSGSELAIDADEYGIAQHDKILGILLHCCGVSTVR